MPLRDDLLKPIPGANPAGVNLRYAPTYDKIKEARREDDDAPQGEWRRERKQADWALTIKLTTEALSKNSKDLQLTAWLTEALLRKQGIPGLLDGLDVLQGMVETLWDNLYPEIDDGDAEFRAAPLQWVGDRLEQAVKSAPLTRSGLDYYKYKESRAVGFEADIGDDDSRATKRQQAISEGKLTGEAFDEAFDATSKAYYVQLEGVCDAVLEKIGTLSDACDARFGDVSPTFSKLREVMEELRQTVHILLQKKREKEPDAPTATEPEPQEVEEPVVEPAPAAVATAGAAAAPARAKAKGVLSEEPVDRDDAVGRVAAAARYIRKQEPYSPAPYLMLRGLRWGELRANGATIDQLLLEAPSTEIRQQLKRLALELNWIEVLEHGESAMAMPCARGWLDLQRYVCRACTELGSWYYPISDAIKSELRALLHDFPDLVRMTLMDDTPTANQETQAWLQEVMAGAPPPPAPAPAPSMVEHPDEAALPGGPPDAFELAMQAAAAGRHQEGIEILSREISHERSGRGRFHRRVQMAQLCLSIGREGIAYPILNELAGEIEQRRLEEWEASDAIAHPLTLLFRCLSKIEGGPEEKVRLYNRICRLDPVQAMACSL